eukprot:13056395-Ditylum_brightwellii.AAC.1
MASDDATSSPSDTNAANSTTARQRVPPWKDGSPKHVEFLTLCERKQWDTLPMLGGDVDLDMFWKEG